MITNNFTPRHNGVSREADVQKMLQTIGVGSMDELIEKTVPAAIRAPKPLPLEQGINEYEFLNHCRSLAKKNRLFKTYIGMGYYGTITPAVIMRNVFENPGWYTSYTPYQTEISQGRLEALMNYQTMVADMTGLPLSNASLLDEASAAGEAMIMFFNSRSREAVKNGVCKVFVDEGILPQTLAVMQTNAAPRGIEIVTGKAAQTELDASYFAAFVQYPNQFGEAQDWSAFIAACHAKGIFVGMATDLMALALMKTPGEMGADCAFGSAQRFGIPMGFGGPAAGFFAFTDAFKRAFPGRIIGWSVDAKGNPALRMALGMREQHIKRDKATSNICTASALVANMSGFYAVWHGPEGICRIAANIHGMAHKLAGELEQYGYKQHNRAFFDTLALASVAVITALRSDAFASGLLLGRARLGARSPLGIGAAMGFFAVAGMYMPLCIVPLFMRELARGQSLLSPEIMMSLPVSADMAAVLAASLLMLLRPALASRWEALLPLGIMLACAAMAGCALAPSAPAFIASRLCYGLGYGFFIIGMQVFAVSASKAGSSGQGLGAVFSSLFAGTVCGCVTGGIAADIMGYRAVFAISCAVLLLPLACALRMRQAFGEKKDEAPACAQPRRGGALRILRDPGFLRLMIFNVLPYGAAVTGIFNFFVPVLINRGGYGSSVVGELTLIYALTVSLLSPLAGRLIDRVRNKSRALSLGGLFAALALSSLIIPSPLAAAAASLLFLGLCAALCESGQPAAVTAGSAGDPAQTLVLLDVFIRIGQFAGPLAISLLVTAGGATHAFAALALLEIACAALLLLSSRQAR